MKMRQFARAARDRSTLINHALAVVALKVSAVASLIARWTEAHAVRIGMVCSTLPNGTVLRLVAGPGDGIAKIVWWGGWRSYEPEASSIWFALSKDARIVLDIGANSGFFALLASCANPSAVVHAFEPVPHTFRSLQANVEANLGARVVCHKSAISDEVGETTIYTLASAHNDLMATLEATHPVRGASDETLDAVPCMQTTVDRFVEDEQIIRVDLIKVDVETAESRVLRGMEAVLERDHPTIVLEVLTPAVAETVELIAAKYGYDRWILTPSGPINVVAVRADAVLTNYLLTTRRDFLGCVVGPGCVA